MESLWETHLGLLTGTYQSQAPPFPQRQGDRPCLQVLAGANSKFSWQPCIFSSRQGKGSQCHPRVVALSYLINDVSILFKCLQTKFEAWAKRWLRRAQPESGQEGGPRYSDECFKDGREKQRVGVRERLEEAMWLALPVEEGALNQGMQVASRSRKRQENILFQTSGRNIALRTASLQPNEIDFALLFVLFYLFI